MKICSVLLYGDKTVLQKSKAENALYVPLCSLSTPVASRSGSPRLMSLIRVPTHSIWSTLHHSSASRSAGMPRGTVSPVPADQLQAARPAARTWFTSKGLGGVVIEINPDGVLLGALGQPSYVLHIVEFCHLENGQSQVGSHSPDGASHQQPPTKGRHREEHEHSLTVSSKLRLTPVSSLAQSKEGEHVTFIF